MADYRVLKDFKWNKSGFDRNSILLKTGKVYNFSVNVSSLVEAGYLEEVTKKTLENKDLKSNKKK